MNKLYICLLFCMFSVSSSYAMEVSSDSDESSESMVTCINLKTSKMSEIIELLIKNGVNISETAFIFDYDETVAQSIVKYNENIKFKLILSPEKGRTYQSFFVGPCKKYNRGLGTSEIIDILGVQKSYEVLDNDVIALNAYLSENAKFVGVCSGLPLEEPKKEILKAIGIDENKYFFASGRKAGVIFNQVKKLIQDNLITTIVLLDNSKIHAIDPFINDMYQLLENTNLQRPMKVIGIEYTKFEEMLKQEDIERELELLKNIQEQKEKEARSSVSVQNFSFPNVNKNY